MRDRPGNFGLDWSRMDPGQAEGAGAVIVARGLLKSFGPVRAVDGVDLVVRQGECLGMLGPNGAGNTSTVRILHDASRPDRSTVSVLGLDVTRQASRSKRRVGVRHSEGPPEDLVRREIGRAVIEVSGYGENPPRFVQEQVLSGESHADRLSIVTGDGERMHKELVTRFHPRQCLLRLATLEDVFLEAVGVRGEGPRTRCPDCGPDAWP